jgi:hypothetical protein
LSSSDMPDSTHESFKRDELPLPGSDRTFGWVMAGALALLSLLNGWHRGRLWPWTLAAAVLFLLAVWLRPSSLHRLNWFWTKFGLLLHKIVSPLVMGLVFYGTIVPTSFVMRVRGKNLLRLNREPQAKTYWIVRTPGPPSETMKDQF